MKIITATMIKGGSGKTTTLAALAQAAAHEGEKVLVIDLDPQANLTTILGADHRRAGSVELLQGADVGKLAQHTKQGIDVISGSVYLSNVTGTAKHATQLRDALNAFEGPYKLIFIDTPPSMSALTYNALQTATSVLFPLEADASNVSGLFHIVNVIRMIQTTNPKLQIAGTVITRYDGRPKLNRYFRDMIAEKGAEIGAPLIAEIRPSVSIREAQAMKVSLYDYAPNSKPALDYMELLHKLTK